MAGLAVALVYLLRPKEPTSAPKVVVLKPADGSVLEEINENMEQAPSGEIMSNKSVAVTDQIIDLYQQKDKFPMSICDITNVGPSPVYIGVNHWDYPEAPLPVGQSIHIDMKRKFSIKRIYLKCDTGLSTAVSLYFVR